MEAKFLFNQYISKLGTLQTNIYALTEEGRKTEGSITDGTEDAPYEKLYCFLGEGKIAFKKIRILYFTVERIPHWKEV